MKLLLVGVLVVSVGCSVVPEIVEIATTSLKKDDESIRYSEIKQGIAAMLDAQEAAHPRAPASEGACWSNDRGEHECYTSMRDCERSLEQLKNQWLWKSSRAHPFDPETGRCERARVSCAVLPDTTVCGKDADECDEAIKRLGIAFARRIWTCRGERQRFAELPVMQGKHACTQIGNETKCFDAMRACHDAWAEAITKTYASECAWLE